MTTRSIKFRVWDRQKKRVIDVGSMNAGLTVSANVTTPEGFDRMIIDGETGDFMQYTGFLDNTGKEIYQGDILRFTVPKTNPRQKQKYHYWAVIWYQKKGEWYVERRGQLDTLWSKAPNHRVVGDVYSNSELLKG